MPTLSRHPRVLGVLGVHVVALLVGDHLQGQLVVVAQERAPLAARGIGGVWARISEIGNRDSRRTAMKMRGISGKWNAMWHSSPPVSGSPKYSTTSAGHRFASASITRPGILVVDHLADPLEVGVRLGQVRAVGALPLEQVGHRVQPEAVDAEVEPEPDDVEHRLLHGRVVVVEVRLVGEEPVPVELLPHRVEGPVRRLGVAEDDPHVGVLGVGVAPDVEVAVRPVGVAARLLEPRVRVGGVVEHQVGDDPDAAAVRLVEQGHEVVDRAVLRQHLVVVADVVAAVAPRRVVERRQPEAVDAEPLQVVELVGQPAQVAGAVVVGVEERLHQHLVEHGPLVPGAVLGQDPGVAEVVGGGMLDHAVLDVAALGGIVLDVLVGATDWIHRPSNLPKPAEIESRPPGHGSG